jgi:hypothetical protein
MIRQVGLAKLRGKHMSDAVSTVYEALLSLRQGPTEKTPFVQLRGEPPTPQAAGG